MVVRHSPVCQLEALIRVVSASGEEAGGDYEVLRRSARSTGGGGLAPTGSPRLAAPSSGGSDSSGGSESGSSSGSSSSSSGSSSSSSTSSSSSSSSSNNNKGSSSIGGGGGPSKFQRHAKHAKHAKQDFTLPRWSPAAVDDEQGRRQDQNDPINILKRFEDPGARRPGGALGVGSSALKTMTGSRRGATTA